jgi:hypothetical protein
MPFPRAFDGDPRQEVVDLENFPHSSVIKVPLAWI